MDTLLDLSNIAFIGFSRQEMRAFERYIAKREIKEYSFELVGQLVDIAGRDIGTMIEPGGKITLLGL